MSPNGQPTSRRGHAGKTGGAGRRPEPSLRADTAAAIQGGKHCRGKKLSKTIPQREERESLMGLELLQLDGGKAGVSAPKTKGVQKNAGSFLVRRKRVVNVSY